MKRTFVIAVLLILITNGCTTALTARGRNITVVNGISAELVNDCQRLGAVTGFAQPGWGNDVGLDQAFNDARNKASEIPDADTFAISSTQRQFNGGEVTGIVFNCRAKRVQLIQNVAPTETTPDNVFEKAKKCQEKKGVWVNNQCVISVE